MVRQGMYFEAIISILSRCFVVFCCMPIHELAHGFIAYKLGDNTAKNKGRLTFNPLAHLSPLGTIMIFLFGIGYANPVPINPNNFKKPKVGMAITALAGPLCNIFLGFVSIFFYYMIASLSIYVTKLGQAVAFFFFYAANINVTLAVFNLIPIPPLDGSKVLASVLPDKAYYKYMMYERYVMIALMVLLFSGVLDGVIMFLSRIMMNLIAIIPSIIF